MKYHLNIQLEAMHTVCPELDIYDAFVLDYIKDYFSSTSTKIKRHIDDDGRMWVWVKLSTVVEAIPSLRFSDKTAVSKIISRLVTHKMLDKKKVGNDLFVSLTTNVDLLYNSGRRATVATQQHFTQNAITSSSDAPQPLPHSNGSVATQQRSIYRDSIKDTIPPKSPTGDLSENSPFTGETPEPPSQHHKPLPNPSPNPIPTLVVPMSYASRSDFENEIEDLRFSKIPHRIEPVTDDVLRKWGEKPPDPPVFDPGIPEDPEALERLKTTNPKLYKSIQSRIKQTTV